MFQRCGYCLNRIILYCLAVRNNENEKVYHPKCLREYKKKVKNVVTLHKVIWTHK